MVGSAQQARRLPNVSGLSMKRSETAEAMMPSDVGGSHFVETFNANQGKQTLKKRLSCTKSFIVLAQEIGHHDWECEALSSWASMRKWQVLMVPGAPTAGKLPSAGLAIFVREGIGLRGPTYPEGAPLRGVPR